MNSKTSHAIFAQVPNSILKKHCFGDPFRSGIGITPPRNTFLGAWGRSVIEYRLRVEARQDGRNTVSRLLTSYRVLYALLASLVLYFRYRETGNLTELLIGTPVALVGFEVAIALHRWKTKVLDDLSFAAQLDERERERKRKQPQDLA